MTRTDRFLEKVEDLTTERWGRGAAVSVDEEGRTCFVRCWNPKGVIVNEVSRKSKTDAVKAMLADLRMAKAALPVEPEES